jgi:hypothetical protein
LGDSLDGEGSTYLQEVLEMCVGMLMSFPTEGTRLHHRDQHCLELKVRIPIDYGSTYMAILVEERAGNSLMILLAMTMFGGGRLRRNAGSVVDKVC